MKRIAMLLLLPALLLVLLARADAATQRKDCAELRDEIAAKIEARGVSSYSLQIVPPDSAAAGRVVGSCDGGSRRIVYQRIAIDPAMASALRAASSIDSAFVSETAAQDRL